MTEIIAIRFKDGGKQYYFAPNGHTVTLGQGVIVETAQGMEYGICTRVNQMIDDAQVVEPLRPVLRIATAQDEKTLARNKEKQERVLQICQEKVNLHGLDMKLVEAEYNFEGNKVVLFFTSEGRVDFRALVKDLAAAVHARIELRQIGVRDEAKLLGGLGICGQPLCCARYLDEFQPVSIKMAKTQSLSLNPTKISGNCGRLMCCLKYEQEAYEDLVRTTPKQDSFVETPDGTGTITSVNLLKQQVTVRLDGEEEKPQVYKNCEVRVVRSGKGKRPEGYIPPPKEELARLRCPKSEAAAPEIAAENSLAAALQAVLTAPEDDAVHYPRDEKEQSRPTRRRRAGYARQGQGEKRKEQKPQKPTQEKQSPQTASRQTQGRGQAANPPHTQKKQDGGKPQQGGKAQGAKPQTGKPQQGGKPRYSRYRGKPKPQQKQGEGES